jgi:DnaJ-domain-containing protein 1
MVVSHDELLMEIAREMRLDRMGEDEDDEEEEQDVIDGADAAAPPPPVCPAAALEEINKDGPAEAIPKQEAPMPQEVVPADAEPVVP